METRDQNNFPKLEAFNYKDFFEPGMDERPDNPVPKVTLNTKGIGLVGQYYSDKYQMENLKNLKKGKDELFENINSDDFYKMVNAKSDIRIPFIMTSEVTLHGGSKQALHSTPIVYIKEGDKEALLIFDSVSISMGVVDEIARESRLTVYTVSGQRQLDSYSCHTDALVLLRELTGKDADGNYFIPNFLTWLEKEGKVAAWPINQNLKEVTSLLDRLHITVQNPQFMKYSLGDLEDNQRKTDTLYISATESGLAYQVIGIGDNQVMELKNGIISWDELPNSPHETKKIIEAQQELLPKILAITSKAGHTRIIQQDETKEMMHKHKGQLENIDTLLQRYPPDEVTGKRQYKSSYLRKKGLKFAHIIEIQFYLNQLKDALGVNFTKQLRANFIREAKDNFNKQGKISFLSAEGKKSMYEIVQKYLKSNFKLDETQTNSETNAKGKKSIK